MPRKTRQPTQPLTTAQQLASREKRGRNGDTILNSARQFYTHARESDSLSVTRKSRVTQ
jgi:hypothetical protein